MSLSLLKGCLRIGLLVTCGAAVAAGCGGLRELPLTSGDGGPVGAGGSSAGAGARGGRGGAGGTGGNVGGTGGSVVGGTGGGVVGGTGGSGTGAGGTNVDGGPSCVAGAACVPTGNPCHKGMFVCMEGVMSCMELSTLQANGTACDTDKVCHNGSCDTCMADMACDVSGKPCRVGTIVCTTGAPVCTETDNKPNGTACGTGMVCQGGSCAACQANASCQPTNKCHNGTQVCTPSIACTDANTNIAAGTACGTDMVCDGSGTCTSCMVGADCPVPGKPCSKGTTACNTGRPVCIESGNAPNGTACGTNKVCAAGVCSNCSAGSACIPGNPCHGGVYVCTPDISCTDTGNPLSNGQTCGTGRVCNGGNCVACPAGDPCLPPTNACRTGTVTCATGSPVCSETGNQPNGTSCGATGSGMVCNGGNCAPCMTGSCVPTSNPCHTGTLSCSTGTSTCNDTGTNAPDGTNCGMNLVCKTGMCVSCTAGQPCQPTNQCKNGMTSCSTGASVCVETGNKGAGILCGAGQSCAAGVLTLPAMCNASGMCSASTMQCPSNTCNTAGTDCATCPSGQTNCPAGCKDLMRDPANCSQCGNVCPAPAANGIPICINSTCDVQCNSGYLACDPGLAICQPTLWTFEDGLLSGWKILGANPPGAVAGKPAVTSNAGHTSKFSLTAPIDATDKERIFDLGPPICAGKGVSGKGFTVTAYVALTPLGTPATPGRATYFGVVVTTESGDHISKVTGFPGYGTWVKISTSVPGDSQLIQFAVEGGIAPPDAIGQPTEWTGTVYIDDVTIN